MVRRIARPSPWMWSPPTPDFSQQSKDRFLGSATECEEVGVSEEGDAGKFSLNPIMYSLYSLLVSTFSISRLIFCHTIYVSCIQLSISASRYFFWLTFERRITCTITMINYCQMWLSSQTMVTRILCPIHRSGHSSCHHHQPYWRNVVVPPYSNASTDNSSAIDVINWSNWSLSWCCYIKWNEMNFV
jgi:hypothetical protein